jgi:GT2 family glycosyltransferase
MEGETERVEIEGPPLLVSVVIVTYNGRKYVPDLLASLLDQDFPSELYQVIVLDNNSQDGTADLVEQCFPSVRLIRLDRNYGPGPALLRARTYLQGRYLAYLNQDVVVHRRWLVELVEVMTTHPQARIVESNVILPQWPEYEGRRRDGPLHRAYVCDFTANGVYEFTSLSVEPDTPPIPVLGVYGAGFLLDLRLKEALGYLTEPGFAAHAEDMDLGLRVNAAGYQVLLAPQSVIYHDTRWYFGWDWRNLRRAFLATQNTILAFYKISYASEFVVLLPRLLLGKLLKAGRHCRSSLCAVAYAIAAMPVVLAALGSALLKMPSFRERRRVTMNHRKTEPGWLVDRMLRRNGKPDPAVLRDGPDGEQRR